MLSVSNLVNVTISLSQLGASGRSFGTLMIAGDSGVISGLERFRSYSNISGVVADFGSSAPESVAASLYFGQKPQPSSLMIGAWLRTATSGMNQGGILTPLQQSITNFNAISNGAFDISIDGSAQDLTGINFNGVTNLNGVATAVNNVLTGAVCTWNGSQFIITSSTSGAGAAASGTITFTGTGTATDTLTLGGTSIEFVSSTPTGNEVLIGGSASATAGNLQTFLQNSSDVNISKCTYSLNGAVVTATYKLIGTGGNAFSMAKSSTAITISAGDLAGGTVPSSVGFATSPASGTDISALLQLTSALSTALVPGYPAETPLACVTTLAGLSTSWYGIEFAASVMPTDSQNLAIAPFIEAQDLTRMFGVTIVNTNVLSDVVSNDLASLLEEGGYDQTTSQYSSSSPYAISSLFGRAFSVDFSAANSTIALMYKQEPGVDPENLTQTQAATLQSKNCNVYASYDNDTQIIQYGVMASGQFFDTIHGVDWFQNALQTALYNVLYTSTTKVPQTDPGVNQLVNACNGVCGQAVNNGLAAPGTWNGPSFGSIATGQYLKNGYYVYVPSVSTQSESDRAARKSPPIQIALKLAGAIQSVDVLVTVNQ